MQVLPASNFFWDAIHPTMTVHCDLAENILEQISLMFGHGVYYTPQYEFCHETYSQRTCADCAYVPIDANKWYLK